VPIGISWFFTYVLNELFVSMCLVENKKDCSLSLGNHGR
jgi:hypothetical protein